MHQMTLTEAPSLDTKRDLILAVLRDGRWHGGGEFMDARHGFRCSSYSQRIGQLARAGHRIERDRRGDDGLGRYRLIEEAS